MDGETRKGGACVKRHYISEQFAKSAIYMIFSLMLFACALYWYSGYSFSRQQSIYQLPSIFEDDAADMALALPQVGGTAGLLRAPNISAKIETTSLPELAETQPAAQDMPRIRMPRENGETPMPELAELESELERLRAMGIELPPVIAPMYSGTYYATAYCCEVYPHICGGNGVTASGTVPTPGLTCAADWSVLPRNTWLYIEGVGIRRVEDTGSAIKQARLDIAIDTHQNALRWRGLGNHEVWIIAEAGFRNR